MLQNKKKRLTAKIAVLVLVLSLILGACGGGGNKALAVYKNAADSKEEQKITQDDYDRYLGVTKLLDPNVAYYEQDPGFRKNLLEQIVSFQVFSSRVDDAQRAEALKEAETEYEQFLTIMEQSGKDEMDKYMKDLGISKEDIQGYINTYKLATVYLQSKVGEDQIKAEYDKRLAENPNIFTLATVSHILIKAFDPRTQTEVRPKEDALKLANEVRDKIVGGADFGEMAKQYSEDEGSKDKGGTYTETNVNGWVENFKKAALELPLHEVSEPVETEYGYHIVRVDDRKEPTYDEVKEMVRGSLIQGIYADFMEKELQDLIVKIEEPKAKEAK